MPVVVPGSLFIVAPLREVVVPPTAPEFGLTTAPDALGTSAPESEPPACAKAKVLASANAEANAIVLNFMFVSSLLDRKDNPARLLLLESGPSRLGDDRDDVTTATGSADTSLGKVTW
jgi:hypothetical protein